MSASRPRISRISGLSCLIILFTFLAVGAKTFYTTSSNKSSSGHPPKAARHEPAIKTIKSRQSRLTKITEEILPANTLSPAFMPQAAPSITTYSGDCSTEKDTFVLGETVCVKTTGFPVSSPAQRSVTWSNPESIIVNRTDLETSPDVTFTLPGTQTSDFGANGENGEIGVQTVDNRGTWRVNISPVGRYSIQASAVFTVTGNNATADVSVYNFEATPGDGVTAGGDAIFDLYVTNFGPNAASNVEVKQPAPANTTFDSVSQVAGPAFVCGDPDPATTCKIASLPSRSRALLRFVYKVNAGAAQGTVIEATAEKVGATTTDLYARNDLWKARTVVAGTASETTCTLTCPNDITVTATHPEGAVVEFDVEPAGDCGALNSSQASGSFFPVGTTTVTTTGTDGGSCSFTVHVIDPVALPAPAITCPADKLDITAPTGSLEVSVDTGTPTTSGTVLSVVGARSDGVARLVTDPYSVGETTITWTARDQAMDENGQFPPLTRSASCTQKIVVKSNDAPTISCSADKTFDAAANLCERTLTLAEIGEPTATGTGVEVEGVRSDRRPLSDPFSVGQTTITWTATDSVGRVVSCPIPQTITIRATGVDNAPPVLNMPDDVEVTTSSCTAVIDDELGVATATDSCGGGVKITRTGVPTGPVVIRRRFPLPPLIVQRETFIFPVGTTIITYTATDASGNVTTKTQKVVVKEDPAIMPTITAPPDITVNADAGSCGASVALGNASTADNCGVASVTNDAPASFPVGTTTVTWTVTDKSGNTATDVQDVTVVDNQNPTIMAPENKTFYTGATAMSCDVSVSNSDLGAATASDNCPGVTVERDGGNTFPVGETIITYTATDAHGRKATATQKITVVDKTPPVITPPANIIKYLPLNSTATSMAVEYNPATATDNCAGDITIGYSHSSGAVFPVGTTAVTVTATDAHNNSATATFTVTVLYNFTGFFQPISNTPTLNSVNAGRAIPVKFSLSGNKGLGIMAANSPYSISLDCGSGVAAEVEETLTAGSSSLTYNSTSDQYHYVWKTENSWAGTCRQLVIKLNDGSEHTANFKFK